MTHGVALLADVTGRDLIVALARPGDAPGEHRVLPGSTSLELEAGLKSVLAELDADVLVGAAVAAAGPEIDGAVTLTSTGLTVSLTWLRHVLRTPRVYLVNDFTACAMQTATAAQPRLAVARLNIRGVLAEMDEDFLRLTGFSGAELLDCRLTDIVRPSDRRALSQALEKVLQGGPAVRVETALLVRAGEERPVELSLAPILHDGAADGVMVLILAEA